MTESHYLKLARLAAASGSDALVELRFRQAEECRRLRDLTHVVFRDWLRHQTQEP